LCDLQRVVPRRTVACSIEQAGVTDAMYESVLEASRERSLMSVMCPVCVVKSYTGFTCQACGESCRLMAQYVLEKQIGKGGFGILLLGRDYDMPSQPPRVLKRCDPRDPRVRRYPSLAHMAPAPLPAPSVRPRVRARVPARAWV
jgi:hypothetical protein